MLDEMDRALHDSLCVIKRMLESNSLVAGGGAVETALSIYLDGVATSMGTRFVPALKLIFIPLTHIHTYKLTHTHTHSHIHAHPPHKI